MKKILLLSAAVLSILAAVSCAKEEQETENRVVKSKARTTLTATLQSSKTALGDMVEGAWPNFWKTDDQISVNGVISDPLDANYDGQTDASFSFEGLLTPNYYAAYPASAVSGYDQGNATITVPAVQNFANGTYDPAAFIMGGVSDSDALVLSPKVSVIHLSFTGSASICKIKLTGASEAALSGTFSTNFTDFTPVNVSNVVELKAADAIQLPADFFISVPVGLVGALNVTAYDSDGGKMSRNATVKSALAAGQVYSPSALAYTPSYAIEATAEGITSSTAIICWDNCGDAGHCPAYTVSVYSDAGCNDLVASYAVPAGDACWGNEAPRFCISGLAANTTYYVKVANVTKGSESEALPVTTAAFDIVQVSNTPAEAGDVILAEDFGELRWDSELIGRGVGYFPNSQDSFNNHEAGQFLPIDTNTEKVLGDQSNALAGSRLVNWAQGANNNLYIHPGYIKLVGSKKVTHIVTPALNNIPEDEIATVEVEITACPYFSESAGSFCTTNAIVAIQTGNLHILTDLEQKTNTLDLTSNVQNITLEEEGAWHTYKVTLSNVMKGNSIAFGAASTVSGNDARMLISDIKVTIKALNEPGDLVASVKSVSSSTATFSWTHLGQDAEYDVGYPYTAAIYSDEDCTSLVVSHHFDVEEESNNCWYHKVSDTQYDPYSPCFSFGGLTPSTDYWFVVKNTESNEVSKVVRFTTEAFTPVDATTVSNADVGDVILAEDFSEVAWSPDELAGAAGFIPSPKTLDAPSGESPNGYFTRFDDYSQRLFGTGVNIGDSRMSKGWGFFGNSSTFIKTAYMRVGGSGGRTHIVTPALAGIPDGQVADIEVTITATKYDSGMQLAAFAEKGLTMNSQTNPSEATYKKYSGASLSDGQGFDISSVKGPWETKTVTLSGVDNECQLLIGSLSDNSGKNRFYLKDIVVTIVDLRNLQEVVEINDFDSFKTFLTVAASGLTVQGNVNTDLTITSQQLAQIDALYPLDNFKGSVNGNNRTISGLTQPLFDLLMGTVQDLTLNSNITATDESDVEWGILAKCLYSDETVASVSNCTAQGSITYTPADAMSKSSDLKLGGLIGNNRGGIISGCTNEATVTFDNNGMTNASQASVGGVIGRTQAQGDNHGNISDCTNNGTVVCNAVLSENLYIGGVLGYGVEKAETMSGCSNSGLVKIGSTGSTSAALHIGGVVGMAKGTMTDLTNLSSGTVTTENGSSAGTYLCQGGVIGRMNRDKNDTYSGFSNDGTINVAADGGSSCRYVGGVAGRCDEGATITNFTNSGNINYTSTASKKTYIGGIVASNNTALSDCSTTGGTLSYTGSTTGGSLYIGGIVGYSTKAVSNCINAMALNIGGSFSPSGSNYYSTGGVVGYLAAAVTVSDCLNTGNITWSQQISSKGYTFLGGVVGNAKGGSIENCSNGGTVTYSGKNAAQNPFIGGVIGTTGSDAEHSISGKYSTAPATNYGEVVINTTKQSSKYLYVGGVAGRLHTNGTMTATNNGPITVTKLTCTSLYLGGLTGLTNASSSIINSGSENMADGDITISGLTSNQQAYVGGVVGVNNAAVSANNAGDVVVNSDSEVKRSYYLGGISGRSTAPLTSCTNSGLVSNAAPMSGGGDYFLQIGGIAGYNNGNSPIHDCHNTANVINTADSGAYLYVGGITSESDALISDSDNTGDVSNSGESGNGHPICIGGVAGVAGGAGITSSSNGTSTNAGGAISNAGNCAEDICIGGVVGWNNQQTITTCFNKGDVSNAGSGMNIAVGGVVGWSSVGSTYVDPNTSSGAITNTGIATTAAYTGDIIGHQAE